MEGERQNEYIHNEMVLGPSRSYTIAGDMALIRPAPGIAIAVY